MAYDTNWDELAPAGDHQVLSMARRAGFNIELRKSEMTPGLRFFVRIQGGKITHQAVPPPDTDRYVSLAYIADKLGIPREVFKV